MTHTPPSSPNDPLAELEGDASIPLLTEVVHLPREEAPAATLPATLGEVDWSALAQQVQDNVVERLARESGALLDAQVRDMLGPVLERASRQLSADLEVALSEFTRDLVARAVSEEITRVHAEIAQREDRGSDRPPPG